MNLSNVDTTGDATDFGNLTFSMWINKCSASRVRGVIHGDTQNTNVLNLLLSQQQETQDFGDLTRIKIQWCMQMELVRY